MSKEYPNDPPRYHSMVMRLEKKGMTTSDAQGAADAHFRKKSMPKHKALENVKGKKLKVYSDNLERHYTPSKAQVVTEEGRKNAEKHGRKLYHSSVR